jgi:hypothetical protein
MVKIGNNCLYLSFLVKQSKEGIQMSLFKEEKTRQQYQEEVKVMKVKLKILLIIEI